jgi:hypothetical protein
MATSGSRRRSSATDRQGPRFDVDPTSRRRGFIRPVARLAGCAGDQTSAPDGLSPSPGGLAGGSRARRPVVNRGESPFRSAAVGSAAWLGAWSRSGSQRTGARRRCEVRGGAGWFLCSNACGGSGEAAARRRLPGHADQPAASGGAPGRTRAVAGQRGRASRTSMRASHRAIAWRKPRCSRAPRQAHPKRRRQQEGDPPVWKGGAAGSCGRRRRSNEYETAAGYSAPSPAAYRISASCLRVGRARDVPGEHLAVLRVADLRRRARAYGQVAAQSRISQRSTRAPAGCASRRRGACDGALAGTAALEPDRNSSSPSSGARRRRCARPPDNARSGPA